jgi:head-tail adaptor
MRAGRLDKRVTIQRRTRTRDPASGELVDGWSDYARNIAAQKLEGRVLERYAGQQLLAVANVGFRLRYFPGLLTLTPDEHRLMYGRQEFLIHGVDEIQRRQGVVVYCSARAEGVTALGQPSVAPGTEPGDESP